ncbi:TOPRIM nucleotidyl transferase/hydrolase domain-containing protein, partial [uncultured Gemella sp.]
TKKLYPTSGDGRKKILAYSLLNHITEEFNTNKTIPIFLIEEPENSLHRSMQIALSKQLFNQEIYRYFVMSTHSSEMLYEMDKATLIRLCNEDRTIAKSFLYKVGEEFSKIKRELNESLTTALFADRVLLIEGPSEKVLFEKILQEIQPNYELEGGYILQVDGIKFKPYYKTLINLGINCIVKTDNDLKETTKNSSKQFEYIGYNRCVGLLDGNEWKKWEGYIEIDYSSSDREDKIKAWKKSNFNQIQKIQQLRNKNIYLSKVDLENDLNEAIPETLELWRNTNHDAVPYLQKQKLMRMIKLCDFLKEEDCQQIYNHSLFECLKKLTGDF